jgi:2-dehydro-3-deoxyphosphogluconate aldolase/(4S)-4-hydroxy-2-oxoglutarate aldolase
VTLPQERPQLSDILRDRRIVPVIVSNDPRVASPLAQVLIDNDLPIAEITLRRPNSLELIKEIAQRDLLVGAGSVLNARQAEQAVEAGAGFLVSPGYSSQVNQVADHAGVPVLPGVATATEMMRARDEGRTLLKFFPAVTSGGPPGLKSLAAPLGDLRFVPSGGITYETAPLWFALPSVVAISSSWIASEALLWSGNFVEVGRLIRSAVSLANQTLSRDS